MSDAAARRSLRARQAGVVAVDWTKCFDYRRLVAEELEVYSTLEVTEDLREGGIASNFAWEDWYRFLASRWKTDFGTEVVAAARGFDRPRILSLGCGHGGYELSLARQIPGCRMLGLDINDAIFGDARERAAREGLDVTFQALDLNFVELEPASFDVVFAHASLHHLLNFEHLVAQLHGALVDDGRLVVLDIIGKTQAIFWPENVRFATDLVAAMPERYRHGLRIEPRALFPGYVDGAEQSGMEGIRQEELEEQLLRWFQPTKCFKYNAFVRLICTHLEIAPRWDASIAEDRAYLDRLYRLDLEQIESGALRPTELFAVYEKRARPHETGSQGPGPGVALPTVSVLLACDGTADDLGVSFASVAAQSHSPVEVLLLGSARDPSLAAAARDLAASHPRIRVVEQGQVGPGRGDDWEAVARAAAGELIAPLSSRDAWYPIKLAEHAARLADGSAAMAYCRARPVDERGRHTALPGGREDLGEPPREGLAQASPAEVPRSAAIYRRSSLQSMAWPEGAPGPVATWAPAGAVVFDPRALVLMRATNSLPGDAPAPVAVAPDQPLAPCAEPRPGVLDRLLQRLRGR